VIVGRIENERSEISILLTEQATVIFSNITKKEKRARILEKIFVKKKWARHFFLKKIFPKIRALFISKIQQNPQQNLLSPKQKIL
jgi:hypothetical protein